MAHARVDELTDLVLRHDAELGALAARQHDDLMAIVARHEAEAKTARAALRLQSERLAAELSDPSSDRRPSGSVGTDAAAALDRFEIATVQLERSRSILAQALGPASARALKRAGRIAELERAIAARESVVDDLRSVVAAQRDDLASAKAEIARLRDRVAASESAPNEVPLLAASA